MKITFNRARRRHDVYWRTLTEMVSCRSCNRSPPSGRFASTRRWRSDRSRSSVGRRLTRRTTRCRRTSRIRRPRPALSLNNNHDDDDEETTFSWRYAPSRVLRYSLKVQLSRQRVDHDVMHVREYVQIGTYFRAEPDELLSVHNLRKPFLLGLSADTLPDLPPCSLLA